ncbi:hypothetical protein GE107_14675 [Cohnella sp. CFH 77786]|uniref:HEAT repeat domain-containing protein n=1 Tax=Cohnella sp. CFH 77786 TaxID=2662265 RepID=UPI001C60CD94|nr:hypothetical protein [Cohnella sp. CFH 77786]MBW5447298.1 hypothetical protein [Cohnella sp. CFH 77786]
MNNSLIIVLWAGLTLLSVLTLIFIYLFIKKTISNRYEMRKKKLLEDYHKSDSVLERYLRTGHMERRMVLGSAVEYEAMQEYFVKRIQVVNEEEHQRIQLFFQQHLVDHYRKRLSSRRYNQRISSLLYIERFNLRELLPDLENLLSKKIGDVEKYAVLRVMAGLQSERIIEIMMDPTQNLPDYVCRQLLYPLNMNLMERFIAGFDQCPPSLQDNLLDILRIRNERSLAFLQMLELLVNSEREELRIRAIKALASFGYASKQGLQRIEESLDHWDAKSWQEKLMLTKLMGSIKSGPFLEKLQELISDRSFMIRSEAAASILLYKDGVQILRKIEASHEDRFAQDIAKEMLKRGIS